MPLVAYGHAGQPLLMFPTAAADYLEYERFYLVDAIKPLIESGKLRALGITTASRTDHLPQVAPVGDFVTGYEASDWFGLGAPKGTPEETVGSLNTAVNAGLADPKFRARIVELGGVAIGGQPVDFGKMIADETEKWAKVIRFAGIKPGEL